MRNTTIKFAGICLAITLMGSCASSSSIAEDSNSINMQNTKDSVSYALGVLLGSNFQGQGLDLDETTVASAFGAALRGEELKMDAATAEGIYKDHMLELAASEGEGNRKAGEDFLAANGKKDGVMTTASGLQYTVLQEGTGASPVASDQVKVHYHGTLLDGTVFDSSVDRGEPITFGLDRVIAGWTEGLQLMKEGGKTKFFIPADLAYGDQSPSSPVIQAGSTLIFDVELLEVVK